MRAHEQTVSDHSLRFAPFGLTGPALDERGNIRKMDVAFYQQFVDAVLNELQIKKCVMIGNSFGGFLSWDQAQRHPERVRGLIISDAVGYQQPLPIYITLFTIKPIAWLTRYTVPAFLLRMAVRDVYGDKSKLKKKCWKGTLSCLCTSQTEALWARWWACLPMVNWVRSDYPKYSAKR